MKGSDQLSLDPNCNTTFNFELSSRRYINHIVYSSEWGYQDGQGSGDALSLVLKLRARHG